MAQVLSREALRFSGNKIHCSPWDQSLSAKCILEQQYMAYLKHFLSLKSVPFFKGPRDFDIGISNQVWWLLKSKCDKSTP